MRVILLIMIGWAGLGYTIGDYIGYNQGYADARTHLRETLDKMDEEEGYIVYEENPKWDI